MSGRKMKSVATILSSVFLVAACDLQPSWTAFVYPDINRIPNADAVQNFTIGNYRSFEECQSAAIERIKYISRSTGQRGDYQCGYKCSRRDEFGGMLICKETRK